MVLVAEVVLLHEKAAPARRGARGGDNDVQPIDLKGSLVVGEFDDLATVEPFVVAEPVRQRFGGSGEARSDEVVVADPAAVAYDTVESAKSKGIDVVIVDTAGRLHNKVNLMNELTKVRNVMRKVIPDAPHEVLLVLDASTGQNAIEQAKAAAASVSPFPQGACGLS